LTGGGPANGLITNGLLVLGAAALATSAVIHLHLWMDGYSSIHTIGPLFLAQAIAGLSMAAMLLWFRRAWAALLGLGYLLSTIAGFLLSVNVGLFGFTDTWLAPLAKAAFWDETVGASLLAIGVAVCMLKAHRGVAG
jgi:hypothetical protein